jgi:hypothetical protein
MTVRVHLVLDYSRTSVQIIFKNSAVGSVSSAHPCDCIVVQVGFAAAAQAMQGQISALNFTSYDVRSVAYHELRSGLMWASCSTTEVNGHLESVQFACMLNCT